MTQGNTTNEPGTPNQAAGNQTSVQPTIPGNTITAQAPIAAIPQTQAQELPPQMASDSKSKEGKTVILPTNAFKRIKDEAQEKGRKAALAELAKAHGFSSIEEMQKALSAKPQNDPASKAQKTPDQVQSQKTNGNGKNGNVKWEKERQQMMKEREDLNRRLKYEADKRKELQKAIDAKEAEWELRQSAIFAGVKDVDYALRLLTRDLDGKTEEELKAFDESKFFVSLKDKHPYLFGEVVRPATTGTGINGTPSGQSPADIAAKNAANGKFDAMRASPEEYKEHLRRLGLSQNY